MTTIAAADRTASVDALRGWALCGILLINIPLMGAAWDVDTPLTPADPRSPDWIAWWAAQLFVEGAMRGLFAMLFGAGLMAMSARGASAGLVFRRCLWLIPIGLAHGTLLLWPGEILFAYGIAGCAFIALRWLSPRTKALVASAGMAFLALSGGVLGLEERAAFAAGREAERAAGNGETLSAGQAYALAELGQLRAAYAPGAAALAKEREARLGGYGDNLALAARQFFAWQVFSPFAAVVFLETLATMLFGAALYAWGALTGGWSSSRYGVLAAAGFGLGVPLNALEAWTVWTSPIGAPGWWTYATYEASRLATTLGHIGLVFLLWRAGASKVLGPLAAMGRMALTNYVGQSVIAALVFSGFGLGLFQRLGWAGLWGVAALILAGQAMLSAAWLSRHERGPLEAGWRRLVYGAAARRRAGRRDR